MLENEKKELKAKNEMHCKENTNIAKECGKQVEMIRKLKRKLNKTQIGKIDEDKIV